MAPLYPRALSDRHNILVTRTMDPVPIVPHHEGVCGGNAVLIRWGYTPVWKLRRHLDRAANRIVVPGERRMDHLVRNNAGMLGAFVLTPNIPGIRAAVERLHELWGDLPVQDNSGLVPDLHTLTGVI